MSSAVKAKKFRTINTYVPGRDREVDWPPSLTVPDESMSMREILSRFVNGLPDHVAVHQVHDSGGDADFDDLDLSSFGRMDLTEQDEVLAQIEAEAKEAKARLADYSRARKEREEKAKDAASDVPPAAGKDELGEAKGEEVAKKGGKDESAS